ncbi:MAG: YbaY family lipoprotein [Rhodoblastus sp.]
MTNRQVNAAVFGAALFAAGFLATGSLTGAASAQSKGAQARIAGVAYYRERIALPPNAHFEAQILDVSRADAPSKTVARTIVAAPVPSMIRFEIPYDPKSIQRNARYVVRATISAGGKLWFTTDTVTPVLTHGAGQDVEILLRRAGGGAR